jgi:gliding motility-associated protein GldE
LDSSSPGDIIPLAGQVLTVIFNQDIAAWDIVVSLILITFFMALSALVSSSETAFFSISYTQQRNMEKDGDSIDKAVVEFLDKPRTLLGTILIGNNIFNLTIVALSYRLLNSVLSEDFITQNEIISFVIQIVIVTFFIVMFGEVVPKVYATRNNIGVARSAIRPLQLLHFIFKPLIRLLVASSSALEKKLEGHTKGVSAKDIDDAIDIATENSEEEFSRDTKILKGIVKFGNITATQIMKSRMDVVGVDISTNFAELLGIVRESGYSRIPVFEGDFDKVIGIIYAKDLLPYLDETAEFKWHSLIKPALYVPESKKIDALLEEFQQKRVHMAIVVDEYGGSSGLVTLEDVLEEVIGEIKDEFDDVMEIDFQKIDDHNYLFEGKTAINDVCKVLEIPSDNFDEVRGESDSLAGLLLELKGEMPQKDDLVETDGFSFRVVEMNATRIVKVQVTIDEKN